MYKNSKFGIILPVIIACSVVAGIFLSRIIYKPAANDTTAPARMIQRGSGNKIDALLSLIKNRYVDTVNMDSLAEGVVPMLLENLDPHSVYIPAKDFDQTNESLEGEFDGIGVVFNMTTDTVIVLNVITGGPSAKAGIAGGDRIVKINDTLVAGVKMDQEKVVKRLRGPRGTTVDLGIMRMGVDGLVPITVTRGKIPIKSITAAFMIAPKAGYIKFDQFSRNSYTELIAAVKTLRQQGMERMILDIRGNGGGYMDQAIMISNEFLPDKKLIVYTKDRDGNKTEQYSNGRGQLINDELVVLVDEGSASSSEILAGALQDHDRAIIIGRRTFGKGLVQEQIPFNDGSAVRLTVARYYTPSGRSIQKPYSEGKEQYYNELYSRYEHSELYNEDSVHLDDSLKFTTDAGRAVYGGGGIMPDIFVPADTTELTPYYRQVAGKNILYRYTLDFSDRHRDEINNISNFEQLDAFFGKTYNLLDDFVQYAAKAGVPAEWKEIEQSRKLITSQIKAYVGRNTPLEDNAFYYLIRPVDETLLRALHTVDYQSGNP